MDYGSSYRPPNSRRVRHSSQIAALPITNLATPALSGAGRESLSRSAYLKQKRCIVDRHNRARGRRDMRRQLCMDGRGESGTGEGEWLINLGCGRARWCVVDCARCISPRQSTKTTVENILSFLQQRKKQTKNDTKFKLRMVLFFFSTSGSDCVYKNLSMDYSVVIALAMRAWAWLLTVWCLEKGEAEDEAELI